MVVTLISGWFDLTFQIAAQPRRKGLPSRGSRDGGGSVHLLLHLKLFLFNLPVGRGIDILILSVLAEDPALPTAVLALINIFSASRHRQKPLFTKMTAFSTANKSTIAKEAVRSKCPPSLNRVHIPEKYASGGGWRGF